MCQVKWSRAPSDYKSSLKAITRPHTNKSVAEATKAYIIGRYGCLKFLRAKFELSLPVVIISSQLIKQGHICVVNLWSLEIAKTRDHTLAQAVRGEKSQAVCCLNYLEADEKSHDIINEQ